MDPLAGKYPNLSPYNFVANSSLIFIDPDGEKIRNADKARLEEARAEKERYAKGLDAVREQFGSIDKKRDFKGSKEQWERVQKLKGRLDNIDENINQLEIAVIRTNEVIEEFRNKIIRSYGS